MIQATLKLTHKKASRLQDPGFAQRLWDTFNRETGSKSMPANIRGSDWSEDIRRSNPIDVLQKAFGDIDDQAIFNLANPDLSRIQEAIDATASLHADWNGYGAERPSDSTRETMHRVLNLLASQGMLPDRVVPSAEGGLFMLLKGKLADSTPMKADVESFNSGEVTFAYRPKGDKLTLWEVMASDEDAIRESIERIRGLFA